MKLFTPEHSELIDIANIAPCDDGLMISGTIMGAMPMKAVLTPEELEARVRSCLAEFATAPLFAIPTTAGTGSAASPDAGIHPDAVSRSRGITLRHVFPRVAICDPDFTLTLPKVLTAATGLDAFTHCVEGYIAAGEYPVADALALDGIARIARHLGEATGTGDIESRTQLMWAAFAGRVAIGRGSARRMQSRSPAVIRAFIIASSAPSDLSRCATSSSGRWWRDASRCVWLGVFPKKEPSRNTCVR